MGLRRVSKYWISAGRKITDVRKQLVNPNTPSFPMEAIPICFANNKLANTAMAAAEDISTPFPVFLRASKIFRSRLFL